MQITGGYLKSRKIKVLNAQNVKPTLSKTRQAFYSTLDSLIDSEGAAFLDVFSGSGIMAFEAISRGFTSVHAIEKDRKTFQYIKENAKFLDVKINLIFGVAEKVVLKLTNKFDVIFMDPPYDSDLYEVLLDLIVKQDLLMDNGVIIMEHPSAKSIDIRPFRLIKAKTYGDKNLSYLML